MVLVFIHGALWASWFCVLKSFITFGKFTAIFSTSIASVHFCFLIIIGILFCFQVQCQWISHLALHVKCCMSVVFVCIFVYLYINVTSSTSSQLEFPWYNYSLIFLLVDVSLTKTANAYSFHGCRIQVSWILCWRSHRTEIQILQCSLEPSALFQALVVFGWIQSLKLQDIGICFLAGQLGGCSQLLEAAHRFLPHGLLRSTALCFFEDQRRACLQLRIVLSALVSDLSTLV